MLFKEVEKCKILVLGDPKVGKTALIRRLSEYTFDEEETHKVGIDVVKKHVTFGKNNKDNIKKRFTIEIWDTTNQAEFQSLSSGFYRNADGVIICFDLTNYESFSNIDYWRNNYEKFTPPQKVKETPIALFATKCDLTDDISVTSKMIEDFEMDKYKTSAKTGENVEEAFKDFIKKIWMLKRAQKKERDKNRDKNKEKEKSEENDPGSRQVITLQPQKHQKFEDKGSMADCSKCFTCG
ncbi:unnamed protein product [Moneuplotes crassus]|uniref:Uncharacterized protein n=1 Tax=Euplotes crassus TaxID=5936 RepID=A0AAD2D341_EUPCR|nr:unnamed protein product [Moneuplotes crassus]